MLLPVAAVIAGLLLLIWSADRFVEVYLSAPIEVCRQRDKTGAYEQADAGKMAQFPGVSAAFEPATHADLVLPTHEVPVEQSVEQILSLLRTRGFIR